MRISLATGFFVFWLGVLYAGADHPPPTGFLWAILLDLLAAALVYIRVPTYLNWARSRTPLRVLRALRDGAGVGLIFAAVALLLPGTGQPGIHPTVVDRILWFLVLAAVGSGNAGVTYGLCALLARRASPAHRCRP